MPVAGNGATAARVAVLVAGGGRRDSSSTAWLCERPGPRAGVLRRRLHGFFPGDARSPRGHAVTVSLATIVLTAAGAAGLASPAPETPDGGSDASSVETRDPWESPFQILVLVAVVGGRFDPRRHVGGMGVSFWSFPLGIFRSGSPGGRAQRRWLRCGSLSGRPALLGVLVGGGCAG